MEKIDFVINDDISLIKLFIFRVLVIYFVFILGMIELYLLLVGVIEWYL